MQASKSKQDPYIRQIRPLHSKQKDSGLDMAEPQGAPESKGPGSSQLSLSPADLLFSQEAANQAAEEGDRSGLDDGAREMPLETQNIDISLQNVLDDLNAGNLVDESACCLEMPDEDSYDALAALTAQEGPSKLSKVAGAGAAEGVRSGGVGGFRAQDGGKSRDVAEDNEVDPHSTVAGAMVAGPRSLPRNPQDGRAAAEQPIEPEEP